MKSILHPFTSTYAYQFVYWICDSLWKDGAGRIFLVTIISYFIGISIYGGYISRFSGGFGGLSLSKIDFQITDIITLLPTMIFTIFDLIRKSFRPSIIWIIKAFAYVTSALITGLSVGLYLIDIQHFPLLLIQVGPILYIYSLSFSVIAATFSRQRFWLTALWILQIIGSSISAIAVEMGAPPEIPSIPIFNDVIIQLIYLSLYNFLVPLLILTACLIPMALGGVMADFAIKDDLLSKVAKISLRQPIQILGNHVATNEARQVNSLQPFWSEKWLFRKNLHVSIDPDVYEYHFTLNPPVYLLFSLNNIMGLYFVKQKGVLGDGKIVMLSRDILYSIELYSPNS